MQESAHLLTTSTETPTQHYLKTLTLTPAQETIFVEGVTHYRYGIYPKGRRLGATRGGAEAFIGYMLSGKKCLWVDVIQANIRRYVERYFMPALKRAGYKRMRPGTVRGELEYEWNQQDLVMKVGEGYTDFRSADHPERLEGFGYDITFLNEAGLILDNEYLWNNAVLPMMLDNPESVLIAAGTPKLTLGKGLFFKELWERVQAGREGYGGQRFSTYDNPHLLPSDIDALKAELHLEADRLQEVEGEFVDLSSVGSYFKRSWFAPEDDLPVCKRFVRGWDFAATPVSEINPDPDWTVGTLLGVHGAGLTVADVVKLRDGPSEVDTLIQETAKADAAYKNVTYVIPIDPGSAGKVAAKHYTDLIKKANPKITVTEYPQTKTQGSKAERAKPVSKAAHDGELSYLRAAWNEWFFAQLAAFPNLKAHDDGPDSLSSGFNNLLEPEVNIPLPPRAVVRRTAH